MKYVIPSEGVTYGLYGVAISKTAPHPNAARLMANFYLSEEVQADLRQDRTRHCGGSA